ncbi:MAG: hypothetical protein WC744_05565 [Patescibacteria group bacterium]|jgi:hypothetical protein
MNKRGPRYGSIDNNFGNNELKKNKGNLLWGLVGAALLSGFIVFGVDLVANHWNEMTAVTSNFNETIGIMARAASQNFLPKLGITLVSTGLIQVVAQNASRRDRNIGI